MDGVTRILLIDPTDQWITNSRVLKHHDQVMLPIGLMSLSAYLKRELRDAVEVRIVSTFVDFESPADLDELLLEYRPEIVGVRCVIFFAEQVDHIVAQCRAILPDTVLIAGGPNVTPDNGPLMENADIDVFVEGEGEEPLLEVVRAYRRQGREGLSANLAGVAGVSFRRQGEIVRSERQVIDDLDSLPIPDYEAVDLTSYQRFLNYGYNRRKMAVLFTSRGCPFHCTYCHVVFGKKFRARSARSILDEVVTLYERYGIEDFSIVDDNFTVHHDRVEEFADLMIRKGPKVRFYFPNGVRADSLSFERLERMQAAGTIYMTFSLETASKRLQSLTKKYANIEKLRQIVERSCDLGIITNLCVMVGFPTETLEEAEATLRYFSQFKRIVLPYYFSVKYYPGTELFQTAGEYGITIEPQSYDTPYHGYEFQETPSLSRGDFERLNQWYLRRIYLDSERLANAVSILRGHFSEFEVQDMFTLFFRRPIRDVDREVVGLVAAAAG